MTRFNPNGPRNNAFAEHSNTQALGNHAAMRGSHTAQRAANSWQLRTGAYTNSIEASPYAGNAYSDLNPNSHGSFVRNGGDALHVIGQNQISQMSGGGVDFWLQNMAEVMFNVAAEAKTEGHHGWADGMALASEQLARSANGDRRPAGSRLEMADAMRDLAQAYPFLDGRSKQAAAHGMEALSQALTQNFRGPSPDLLSAFGGHHGCGCAVLGMEHLNFAGFLTPEQAFSPDFFSQGPQFLTGHPNLMPGMGDPFGGMFGVIQDNPFFAGAFGPFLLGPELDFNGMLMDGAGIG